MNEIWKTFSEQLKRSGLSVTILVIGIWGVWDMRNTDIRELRTDMATLKAEYKVQTDQLRFELSECTDYREKLAAKVAVLELQIDFLTGARRLKTNNK